MKKCPVCHVESVKWKFTVKGYPIHECKQCGLGLTEVPQEMDILSIYDDSYFQGGQVDGYIDYLGSEKILRKQFAEELSQLQKHANNSHRSLLEIGCAYGFFLEEAKKRFEVKGLEVAESAVAFCRTRGLDVSPGILDNAQIDKMDKFDVVCFFDVIEHVTDPEEFLSSVARITSKGGIIMFTTGDFKSLISRIMGKKWRLMTPPQHLFFYTRKSIEKLLENAGFQLVELTSPSRIVPMELFFYQLNRITGIRIPWLEKKFKGGIRINPLDIMRVIAVKK